MRLHFAGLILLCSACLPTLDGVGDGGVQEDFGRQVLADGESLCPAAGVSGESVLSSQPDDLSGTLSYRTSEGALVEPTPFFLDFSWPSEPTFVCYPAHTVNGDRVADPRVGVEGVGILLQTTDGRFNETLTATVFRLQAANGAFTNTLVAVTQRAGLVGSFEPPAGFDGAGQTVILTLPVGLAPPPQSGSISLSHQPEAEVAAGIIRSRSAVALFP